MAAMHLWKRQLVIFRHCPAMSTNKDDSHSREVVPVPQPALGIARSQDVKSCKAWRGSLSKDVLLFNLVKV